MNPAITIIASVGRAARTRHLPARRLFSAVRVGPLVFNRHMQSQGKHDCQIVVITSGKGGVGKTTTAANFGFGLAERGKKTCVIDFDVGLRNLDLHLGMERRVVYDIINVIKKEASLHQSLIKDRRNEKLFLLAASQTRDKTALTIDGVGDILEDLKKTFDFVICDSPAGIESGAHHAMYFSDRAVICTNPEMSSIRDSDKMLGIIASKSRRAELKKEPVITEMLITRYIPESVAAGNMMSIESVQEVLGIPLIGVIPDSRDILRCTNEGKPAISEKDRTPVALAYEDAIARFLGEDRPLRFVTPEPKGLFRKLFG